MIELVIVSRLLEYPDAALWQHPQEMYRYLAIANYEDRFVVPSSHRELAREAFPEKNGCGFTFGDGCHGSDSKFNLFNSRRIDAMDVTSKTEPHQ